MSRVRAWILGGLIAGCAMASGAAQAQETTWYYYDMFGRLVSSVTSGGPNNNRWVSSCFDRAGNRMRYDVATVTPTTCPTPTPTPSPSP